MDLGVSDRAYLDRKLAATYLVRRDAIRQPSLDAVARDLTRDKVGKPSLEVDEQV